MKPADMLHPRGHSLLERATERVEEAIKEEMESACFFAGEYLPMRMGRTSIWTEETEWRFTRRNPGTSVG